MLKLKRDWDVLVVGGGVNGCGIARDLALRGIDCLLVEKKDFSQGTSGASSGMIHGGPRYLLGDKNVTRLACLDSGYIQKIAPHLLFRIPFLYPVYQEPGHSKTAASLFLETVESFFEAYDTFVPLKNGCPHTRLKAEEVIVLEPNLPRERLIGAVSFDEWGIDVPRLCLANVLDAVEHGATCLNHTQLMQIRRENKGYRVLLKDCLNGATQEVTAGIVVNATGPWSPDFGRMLGVEIKLRPGKGIHLVFDRRLFNMAIATRAIDGREIFVMPYENTTIIATTDDDYFGDLDEQRVTEDEIKYLLDGIAPVFPQIRESRMIYSYSGVRPTLYKRKVLEDGLSREHAIIDHGEEDNLPNVYSLVGGKLASYRVMAQEISDIVARQLGNTKDCETHLRPLPGGDSQPDVQGLSEEYGIEPFVVSRLVYRHGSRAQKILEKTKSNPELKSLTCPCEPVTQAEINYVIENEFVRTLSDLRLRTRFSQGPCQGLNCLLPATNSLLEHDVEPQIPAEKKMESFLNEWWWNRAAILGGAQLAQEELFQAVHGHS